MGNSSYRNVKDLALFIEDVWGDVTVTGMDINHVTNVAVSIYGK